jgi:hypothetical protein
VQSVPDYVRGWNVTAVVFGVLLVGLIAMIALDG